MASSYSRAQAPSSLGVAHFVSQTLSILYILPGGAVKATTRTVSKHRRVMRVKDTVATIDSLMIVLNVTMLTSECSQADQDLLKLICYSFERWQSCRPSLISSLVAAPLMLSGYHDSSTGPKLARSHGLERKLGSRQSPGGRITDQIIRLDSHLLHAVSWCKCTWTTREYMLCVTTIFCANSRGIISSRW